MQHDCHRHHCPASYVLPAKRQNDLAPPSDRRQPEQRGSSHGPRSPLTHHALDQMGQRINPDLRRSIAHRQTASSGHHADGAALGGADLQQSATGCAGERPRRHVAMVIVGAGRRRRMGRGSSRAQSRHNGMDASNRARGATAELHRRRALFHLALSAFSFARRSHRAD